MRKTQFRNIEGIPKDLRTGFEEDQDQVRAGERSAAMGAVFFGFTIIRQVDCAAFGVCTLRNLAADPQPIRKPGSRAAAHHYGSGCCTGNDRQRPP